jgi:hypothetical protein
MQVKHQLEPAGVPFGSQLKDRQNQHPGQTPFMRRMDMHLRNTLSVMIVALACVVTAQAKNSRGIVLHSDVTVAGSHLASGSYDVTWETHSPEATVSFMRGKKVVATADGKVEDRGTTYDRNEVVYYDKADGTSLIQEIRFKGSSEVLVFKE